MSPIICGIRNDIPIDFVRILGKKSHAIIFFNLQNHDTPEQKAVFWLRNVLNAAKTGSIKDGVLNIEGLTLGNVPDMFKFNPELYYSEKGKFKKVKGKTQRETDKAIFNTSIKCILRFKPGAKQGYIDLNNDPTTPRGPYGGSAYPII
jgi:hypothetical protein